MANPPKKKKQPPATQPAPVLPTGSGPGGAAAAAMQDARDPMISDGTGAVRASQSGLSADEIAALSPLNSPDRKRRRAAAGMFQGGRY